MLKKSKEASPKMHFGNRKLKGVRCQELLFPDDNDIGRERKTAESFINFPKQAR